MSICMGLVRSVELVEVIRVESVRGEGRAPDDPIRLVTQYWSKDGQLLAESDPNRKATP